MLAVPLPPNLVQVNTEFQVDSLKAQKFVIVTASCLRCRFVVQHPDNEVSGEGITVCAVTKDTGAVMKPLN